MCAGCFLLVVKPAKVGLLTAYADLRPPFAALCFPNHTKKAAGVPPLPDTHVSTVLRPTSFPQVSPAVVSLIAVNVVNITNGPAAQHVEECQPVSAIQRIIHANVTIAVLLTQSSAFIADNHTAPRPRPCEQPDFRVVAQQILEAGLR